MNPSDALSALFSPFLQGLFVAAGIGIMLGLEREFNTQTEESHLAGIRTFPLVGMLGYTLAVISLPNYPIVMAAGLIGFFALVTTAYFVQTYKGKLGLTTEIALLLTFLLGILVSTGLKKESLAIAVIIALLLSLKNQAHSFIRQITSDELFAFIKFFVLALLLLPKLPDQAFGPDLLLNYRELGWIVVLVSSIGFAGYLLLKFYGLRKGTIMMAIIGGLYSSTMVAWIFSARSRETPTASRNYTAGVIIASSIMFLRVLLITALFNLPLAIKLSFSCLAMFVVMLFFAWLVMRHKDDATAEGDIPLGNPLNLGNAALFLFLYIAVTFFTFFSRQWFGSNGALAIGAISGIADMDAITISTAKWSAKEAQQTSGAQIILAAILAGNAFKAILCAVRGSALLRKWAFASFGAAVGIGAIFLIVSFL
ncbi:MAG: MgtC/SapB family protein [Bacteroidota bacterium]